MKRQQRILPQPRSLGGLARRSGFLCLLTLAGMLSACSTVTFNQPKPDLPMSLEEANQFLNELPLKRSEVQLALNKEERACYSRFFISDCVDEVRTVRNEYLRAFLVAETKATEIIRLDRYQKRQIEKRSENRVISPL